MTDARTAAAKTARTYVAPPRTPFNVRQAESARPNYWHGESRLLDVVYDARTHEALQCRFVRHGGDRSAGDLGMRRVAGAEVDLARALMKRYIDSPNAVPLLIFRLSPERP